MWDHHVGSMGNHGKHAVLRLLSARGLDVRPTDTVLRRLRRSYRNDCDMYEMYQMGAIGNASMDIDSLIETGGPAW